jgi:hypothetical protein
MGQYGKSKNIIRSASLTIFLIFYIVQVSARGERGLELVSNLELNRLGFEPARLSTVSVRILTVTS